MTTISKKKKSKLQKKSIAIRSNKRFESQTAHFNHLLWTAKNYIERARFSKKDLDHKFIIDEIRKEKFECIFRNKLTGSMTCNEIFYHAMKRYAMEVKSEFKEKVYFGYALPEFEWEIKNNLLKFHTFDDLLNYTREIDRFLDDIQNRKSYAIEIFKAFNHYFKNYDHYGEYVKDHAYGRVLNKLKNT